MLEVSIKKRLSHYDLEVEFSMGDEILVSVWPIRIRKNNDIALDCGFDEA